MDNKKTKKATKHQRERINHMLESGLIDRAEAQEIIKKERTLPKYANRAIIWGLDYAFWEKRFPGKGKAITQILQPFRDWKPELESQIDGLEEVAKRAIFWQEVKGIRARQLSQAHLLEESLWTSLGHSLEGSFQTSLREPLRASLDESLNSMYWLKYTLGYSMKASLWTSFYLPCAFIIVGNEGQAARFKPLLDLWLAGNFPMGFDREGHLLVIVA